MTQYFRNAGEFDIISSGQIENSYSNVGPEQRCMRDAFAQHTGYQWVSIFDDLLRQNATLPEDERLNFEELIEQNTQSDAPESRILIERIMNCGFSEFPEDDFVTFGKSMYEGVIPLFFATSFQNLENTLQEKYGFGIDELFRGLQKYLEESEGVNFEPPLEPTGRFLPVQHAALKM